MTGGAAETECGDDLWAITAYFNPAGYRSRLANYRRFRSCLRVPLVTVEASFDGRFELNGGDAEILIQRNGTDVLWQKERLLNVAIGFLPRECRAVAWIDCDVVFADQNWARSAVAALDSLDLVQLFSERRNLGRSGTFGGGYSDVESVVRGVVSKITAGEATPSDLHDANAPLRNGSTAGLAWAARRDVLDDHGLYDAAVAGSGDRAILCAALGAPDYAARALQMTATHRAHYRHWAAGFFAAVKGRVGSLDGRVFHLWHGDFVDRRYGERHAVLNRFEFDPDADIAIDGEGCWYWTADKPALREWAKSYFGLRREDGPARPQP